MLRSGAYRLRCDSPRELGGGAGQQVEELPSTSRTGLDMRHGPLQDRPGKAREAQPCGSRKAVLTSGISEQKHVWDRVETQSWPQTVVPVGGPLAAGIINPLELAQTARGCAERVRPQIGNPQMWTHLEDPQGWDPQSPHPGSSSIPGGLSGHLLCSPDPFLLQPVLLSSIPLLPQDPHVEAAGTSSKFPGLQGEGILWACCAIRWLCGVKWLPRDIRILIPGMGWPCQREFSDVIQLKSLAPGGHPGLSRWGRGCDHKVLRRGR